MTWASPVRHPWYDKPSLKRKLALNGQHDTQRPTHPTSSVAYKRRRCDTLEHGFSHLTLGNPQLVPHSQVYHRSIFAVDEPRAMDTNFDVTSSSIIHPSSIEEPPAAIPEIKMKNSSWYEPEKDRIVITDLDDSDSDEERGPDPDLAISSALLHHIKTVSGPVTLEGLPQQAPSMALVLFKPVTVSARKAEEESDIQVPPSTDDCAMDVEP